MSVEKPECAFRPDSGLSARTILITGICREDRSNFLNGCRKWGMQWQWTIGNRWCLFIQEFYEIREALRGKFDPCMSYAAFFDPSICPALSAYVHTLIDAARGVPVLQCCRSFGRVGYLRQRFAGTHILLWNDPIGAGHFFGRDAVAHAQSVVQALVHDTLPRRFRRVPGGTGYPGTSQSCIAAGFPAPCPACAAVNGLPHSSAGHLPATLCPTGHPAWDGAGLCRFPRRATACRRRFLP